MTRIGGISALILILAATGGATRAGAEPPQITLARGLSADIERVVAELSADPAFFAAIDASNLAHADFSEEDLLVIDRAWRDGDAAVIDPILDHPLSRHLAGIVEKSDGKIAEIIIIDGSGANVAVHPKTTDFYQGDEEKWQLTFPEGEDAEFADDVEFDESTGVWQQQVSATLKGDTGAIGAITIGFDIRYSRH